MFHCHYTARFCGELFDRTYTLPAAHGVSGDTNTARTFRESLNQRDGGEVPEGDHGNMC